MRDLVEFTTDNTARAIPVADSRLVAQMFGKEHKNVLRDIRTLLETNKEALREADISKSRNELAEFSNMFIKSTYDADGGSGKIRKETCYLLTQEGFMFIVMGFKGTKAHLVKLDFIKSYTKMSLELQKVKQDRALGKVGRTQLEDSIDNNLKASSFIYTNYSDLINRKVLGMTSKQFKTERGLCKTASIRDYLDADTLKVLNYVDSKVGFLVEHYKDEGYTDKEVYALLKDIPTEKLLPKVKQIELED